MYQLGRDLRAILEKEIKNIQMLLVLKGFYDVSTTYLLYLLTYF